jgi:NADPH:quinone reductase
MLGTYDCAPASTTDAWNPMAVLPWRRVKTERAMVAAVRVYKVGGPEVLTYEDVTVSEPGAGQVRIRNHACGLNFIDAYLRMGLNPSPTGLPFICGYEGAGEVVAAGPCVTELKVGDRVGYAPALGSYAGERLLPADRAVELPDQISYEQAAGMMLKGMTVEYLLHRTFKVQKGMNVLIHAAAGGIGLIASQWANYLGANVIGTVGSQEKAALAKANGCHHTILYREEDFVAKVKEITGGKLCEVVYDGVGRATFPGSLDCIKPLGMFVSFGSSSGSIEPFNIGLLQQKGSLFVTRPGLTVHTAKREDLLSIANNLFNVVASGKVKIPVNQKYALKDAVQAHRDLEAGKTTGSSVLLP